MRISLNSFYFITYIPCSSFLERRLHEDSTKTRLGCRLRIKCVALVGTICERTLFSWSAPPTHRQVIFSSELHSPHHSSSLHAFWGLGSLTGHARSWERSRETLLHGWEVKLVSKVITSMYQGYGEWGRKISKAERMPAFKLLWKLFPA